MSDKRFSVTAATLVVALAILGSSPGCALLSPMLARSQPMVPTPVLPQDSSGESVESEEGETQATLAAVEDFLERTKDYRELERTPAPVTPEPHSSNETPKVAQQDGASHSPQPAWTASPGNPFSPVDHQIVANTQVALQGPPHTGSLKALPVVQSVWIRSSTEPDVETAEVIATNTTNEPLDVALPQEVAMLDRLISQLQVRAAEAKDLASEWQLRFTQLALNHDSEAAQVSLDLPQETRQVLSALIELVSAVRVVVQNHNQNPASVGSVALERTDKLRTLLSARSGPEVAMIAFCQKVVTFGVYEEMAEADFIAGRTVQTIVYSEIRHFDTELTQEGRHRAELAARLEVLTPEGRSMWERSEPEIVDVCRRRRTDFFIAQRITLPPTLPAGDYVLKLYVEDKLSGRADEALHSFVIHPPLSVAGGP